MIGKPALIGINPNTKRCEVVGFNDAGTAEEIRSMGMIAVHTDTETARILFGEVVEDVFNLPMRASRTPIADAVRESIADDNPFSVDDHWRQKLKVGPLRDSVLANSLGLNEWSAMSDALKMRMCTNYGPIHRL